MINWLAERHPGPELMDAPDVEHSLFKGVLKELAVINTLLGGYGPTIAGIKKVAGKSIAKLTIVDIGCGGGDTLLELAKYAQKKGYHWQLIGIDLHPAAVEYAQEWCINYPNIRIIQGNMFDLPTLVPDCDVVINALFMHHLTNEQALACIKLMQYARLGWVINDLHRHSLAYYSIWGLTALLSKSKLVKYDARISVWRGWKKADWLSLQKQTAIKFEISWHWAFRWVIRSTAK